jgi:hypothetical protein
MFTFSKPYSVHKDKFVSCHLPDTKVLLVPGPLFCIKFEYFSVIFVSLHLFTLNSPKSFSTSSSRFNAGVYTFNLFSHILLKCRSQWPCGLRHEQSSLAQTLGSWVRISLKASMSVLCAFNLCLCCSVCR